MGDTALNMRGHVHGTKDARKVAIGSSVGAVIETYDFIGFGTAAALSSRVAEFLGLTDRGRIAPGARADLAALMGGAVITEGSSLRDEGYRVNAGTSFIMTVDYTGKVPQAWAILVYGESGDRTSPVFDSQMVRFSEKNWRKVASTDEQIDSDPDLVTYTVIGR